jgi:hypothetical protein
MSAETIFKPRRYLHFDEPVSEAAAEELATDPVRVRSWPFMPMLRCMLTVKKVKRNEAGHLETKLKEREICYSAHRDAAIYAYYGLRLSNAYEQLLTTKGLTSNVTAFRPDSGKCNIDFAKEAFEWIRNFGPCTALAFDIKSFFDTLDHLHLKRHWAAVLGLSKLPDDHYAVYKSLTRFARVDREKAMQALGISRHNPRASNRRRLCTPEEFREKIRKGGLIEVNAKNFGIPQGSPMSAILSNIYMLPFDEAVSAKVSSVGGLYRRYCDDMLCIVSQELSVSIEAFVMAEIATIKLQIQEAKTLRHRFELKAHELSADKPLQYLGFLFDGNRVLLRNAGLTRFYARMRAGVQLAAATKAKADKRRTPIEAGADSIKRKKLNKRYSYLGGTNFISYAIRSSRQFDDEGIKKQVRRHWRKLNTLVRKAEARLASRRKGQP